MDWWDILKKLDSKYSIQWESKTGNVRAKKKEETEWRYASVSVKADCAESVGLRLLGFFK